MDLRDYLTKKRSVHRITPLCCYEQLITTVLSECHCKQSMFKRLSSTSISSSAKRHHSRIRTFSDAEYPEVTGNVMGPSTTPSKTKGKQPIVSSDESDPEPEGVYQHTCTRTGVIAPVDYSALTRDIKVSESHSAIAKSQASYSSVEKETFAYLASTPEEMARRFEQQAQAQREQLDMIRAP